MLWGTRWGLSPGFRGPCADTVRAEVKESGLSKERRKGIPGQANITKLEAKHVQCVSGASGTGVIRASL